MGLLDGKTAVIYGAGGGIGGAVARAFARAGARVYVTGIELSAVEKLAESIQAHGDAAEAAQVDALSADAVEAHLQEVVEAAGKIDISFNAISVGDVQGIPLVELPLEDYQRPIEVAAKTQFITSTAAARHMVRQKSGVVLLLTASPARIGFPLTGGFGVAHAALEGFTRSLASEVGREGVRVVCIRSAGSPDSPGFQKEGLTNEKVADPNAPSGEEILALVTEKTMLGRLPLMADIGNVAVFAASDMANSLTGTVLNVTAGTTVD